MLQRIDVPRPASLSSDQAAMAGFDIGMAGSPTNIWVRTGNHQFHGQQTLARFDGSAFGPVEVPAMFKQDSVVSSFDVEALAEGDGALLLTTRNSGGAIGGLLNGDGTFTDLSAALADTAGANRTQAELVKRGRKVFARIAGKIFKYADGTFTRLPAAEEAAMSDATLDDGISRVVVGDTVWRLVSGTLYQVFPDDESKVAKLEVMRSVNGGPEERALLKAEQGDLMGSAEYLGGGDSAATESYEVQGLVRGADGSVWVALVYLNHSERTTHLIFRKVKGDSISREERFGLDLDACSTTKIQPECSRPRYIGGGWPGGPMIFASGLQSPISISALLVQTAELR